MEKIIYALWKNASESGDEFREKLRNGFCASLSRDSIHKLKICVSDSDVAPAAPYRMENTQPPVDGILAVWVDTAIYRGELESVLKQYTSRFAGYLVSESEPLVNKDHVAPEGERTFGMNQVVFLQKPPRLSYEEWIDIWHGSHTQVAVDTQSTFGYRQNVITRCLTYGAGHYDAIIEENFPESAIHGRAAFYDAEGDEALLKEREQAMIDSCVRFIDFDKIDCIPMSEYIMWQ